MPRNRNSRRRRRDDSDSESGSSRSDDSYSSSSRSYSSYSSRSDDRSRSSYSDSDSDTDEYSRGGGSRYSRQHKGRASRSKRGRTKKMKHGSRRSSRSSSSDDSSYSSSSSSSSGNSRSRGRKKKTRSSGSSYSDTSSSSSSCSDSDGDVGKDLIAALSGESDGDLSRDLKSLVGGGGGGLAAKAYEISPSGGDYSSSSDESGSKSDDGSIDIMALSARFHKSESGLGRGARRAFKGASSNPDLLKGMGGLSFAPVPRPTVQAPAPAPAGSRPGLMRSFSGRQPVPQPNTMLNSSSMHGTNPPLISSRPGITRAQSVRLVKQQWGNNSIDLSTGSYQLAGHQQQSSTDTSLRSHPVNRNNGLDGSFRAQPLMNNGMNMNGSFRLQPGNMMYGGGMNLSSHGARPQGNNLMMMNQSAHGRLPNQQPNGVLSMSSHGVQQDNSQMGADRRQLFLRQSSDDALVRRREMQLMMQQQNAADRRQLFPGQSSDDAFRRDDASPDSSSRSSRSGSFSGSSESSGSSHHTDLQSEPTRTSRGSRTSSVVPEKKRDDQWIKNNILSRNSGHSTGRNSRNRRSRSDDPPGTDSNADLGFNASMSSNESSYASFGDDAESETGSYADPPEKSDRSDVESSSDSRSCMEPPDPSDEALSDDQHHQQVNFDTARRESYSRLYSMVEDLQSQLAARSDEGFKATRRESHSQLYAMVEDLQNQVNTRNDHYITSEEARQVESRMISKMNELQNSLADRQHKLDLSEEELKDVTSQLESLRLQMQKIEDEKTLLAEGLLAKQADTRRRDNEKMKSKEFTDDEHRKDKTSIESALKSPKSPGFGWLAKQIKERSSHGESKPRQSQRMEPSAVRVEALQSIPQGEILDAKNARVKAQEALSSEFDFHTFNPVDNRSGNGPNREDSRKKPPDYHDFTVPIDASSSSETSGFDTKSKDKKKKKKKHSSSSRSEHKKSKSSRHEKRKKSKKDKKKSHRNKRLDDEKDESLGKDRTSAPDKKNPKRKSRHSSPSDSLSDRSNHEHHKSSRKKSEKKKKKSRSKHRSTSRSVDHKNRGSRSSSTFHTHQKKESERKEKKLSSSSKHRRRNEGKHSQTDKKSLRKGDKNDVKIKTAARDSASSSTRKTVDTDGSSYKFENDDVVGLISRMSAHVSR